jgi:hypothetical protein
MPSINTSALHAQTTTGSKEQAEIRLTWWAKISRKTWKMPTFSSKSSRMDYSVSVIAITWKSALARAAICLTLLYNITDANPWELKDQETELTWWTRSLINPHRPSLRCLRVSARSWTSITTGGKGSSKRRATSPRQARKCIDNRTKYTWRLLTCVQYLHTAKVRN